MMRSSIVCGKCIVYELGRVDSSVSVSCNWTFGHSLV